MRLYLMQHGACLPKEVDPDQPLSPVGREQLESVGRALGRLGLWFDVICASPKLRARQTAMLVARATDHYPERIVVDEAFKATAPADGAVAFLRDHREAESVFVAGHLPSLANIASRLLTSGPEVAIAFENAGLVRLDVESLGARKATLAWAVPRRLLRLAAGD